METIQVKNNLFLLSTKHTSYLFYVNEFSHLEHLHYGVNVQLEDAEALRLKHDLPHGCTVNYRESDETYSLESIPQEYGTYGNGDFREPAIEIESPLGSTIDLIYDSYDIVLGNCAIKGLPSSYGAQNTLIIHLKDETQKIAIDLYYAVYPEEDVISRRAVLKNNSTHVLTLHKMLSYSLDLYEHHLSLLDFNGAWNKEMQLTERKIQHGTVLLQSRTGFSSNKNNPGFILKKKNTTENHGSAWGVNLVYSGNHYSSLSYDEYGILRIQGGIHPDRFHIQLKENESFETPEAVLSFSSEGLNELSHHFHNFINEHIVRSDYKKKARPILINSWEAFGASFKKENLVKLAKEAKKLGIECFVLDDGWFSNRDDDKRGLGDYDCNLKKIPGGIKSLADEIHKLDMQFGIWVEPEAINIDSKLYAAHPEYALVDKEREIIFGRHELLMDLSNPEVRDYIVKNVSELIDNNGVDYVKWDMNRHMNAVSGAYNHEYILGLYEVLERIFRSRSHVLLETCSSGGNRFDLGMLCYSPQIWASDDTDAIERIAIQKGYSYLYPLSTMGAHVSASPHGQTLRRTPLETRFTIAAYGCLGYELDLSQLSGVEKKEVKKQVEYYKEHRNTFQYGKFYRFDEEEDYESFEVKNAEEAIVSKFRTIVHAGPEFDKLYVNGLAKTKMYEVISRPYLHNIRHFGHLINFVSPVKIDGNGHIMTFVSRIKGLNASEQIYAASGAALESGIYLNNLFLGTGYNDSIRLPLDYGSDMYQINAVYPEEKKKEDKSDKKK